MTAKGLTAVGAGLSSAAGGAGLMAGHHGEKEAGAKEVLATPPNPNQRPDY
jgi:hypothetical protein